MNHLYLYIINNIFKLSAKEIDILLFQLEIACLARMLKYKFSDSRSVNELYQLIVEEYGRDYQS